MHSINIFAELGYGNNTFYSTEIEKGTREHRIPRFIVPPIIEGIYVRLWIRKKVFVIATKNGFTIKNKDTNKIKFLFGIEGKRMKNV